MSYVLPPPNAIPLLMAPTLAAQEARIQAYEADLELQQRDLDTMKEGNGPVGGWGDGRARR